MLGARAVGGIATEPGWGHGMWLAISNAIVSSPGGQIMVTSKPNHATVSTFTLTAPMESESASRAVRESAIQTRYRC